MTKLEAVQRIILDAGRDPCSRLDTGGTSEAAWAERLLEQEELRIQTQDWYYNKRWNETVSPGSDGRVMLPAGVITLYTDAPGVRLDFTQLGDHLYDLDNNTDQFTDDLTVSYTLRYDFGCIPQPIQEYIAAIASCRYNQQRGGPEKWNLDRDLQARRLFAKTQAHRFDTEAADRNCLRSADAVRFKGYRVPQGPVMRGRPAWFQATVVP